MFTDPEIIRDTNELKKMIQFKKCDEKALKEFLVVAKGFSESRVESGIQKLKKW